MKHVGVILSILISTVIVGQTKKVAPVMSLSSSKSLHQSDAVFWQHPKSVSKNLIISSDSKSQRLFVYNLSGKLLYSKATPQPGQIDIRYNFEVFSKKYAIIAHNQMRAGSKLVIHAMDPEKQKLVRIDDDNINIRSNIGGCLYRSRVSGKFYYFSFDIKGNIRQFELYSHDNGRIGGNYIRNLKINRCAFITADDMTGKLYVTSPKLGVWEFDAEPALGTEGKKIIDINKNQLRADISGICIYRLSDTVAYLIVSSKGNNSFNIYKQGSNEFLGQFKVFNVLDTEGIAVANYDLGGSFRKGAFICHSVSANKKNPLKLCSWSEIVEKMEDKISAANRDQREFSLINE